MEDNSIVYPDLSGVLETTENQTSDANPAPSNSSHNASTVDQEADHLTPKRKAPGSHSAPRDANVLNDSVVGSRIQKTPQSKSKKEKKRNEVRTLVRNVAIEDELENGLSSLPAVVDNPTSAAPENHTSGDANPALPDLAPTQETIDDLIKFYCDPSKWTNQESREGFMDYEVEEDGFAPNAYGDEDTDDEDAEPPKTFLSRSEKSGLIKMLSKKSPIQDPLERVRRWAPKGLVLSGRQLIAAIHPDRFQKDHEKEMAQKAFVVVDAALNGNRTAKIESTDDELVDFLEEYHEEAHIQVTKYLIQLYEAFLKGESIENSNPNITNIAKTAYDKIQEINEQIRKQNKAIHNDLEFGVIEVDQITNCWKPQNGVGPSLLWKLCESSHYPMGWAYQPPREDFTYDLDRGEYWASMRSRITTTLRAFWGSFLQDYPDKVNDGAAAQEILTSKKECDKAMAELNASKGRPEKLNDVELGDIMAHYCGLKYFSTTSMTEQFQNLRRHLKTSLVSQQLPLTWLPEEPLSDVTSTVGGEESNGTIVPESNANCQVKQLGTTKAVIAILPHAQECTVQPGYTSSGEKIIALNMAGAFRARFVVETRDGFRRLVDSGRAGGRQALRGAQSAGVPCTVTSFDEIERISSMINAGVRRICTYVAMSEWDTSRLNVKGLPKLPYIVLGISMQGQEFHLSQSVLSKIIGKGEVKRLVVKSLGGDEDEDLLPTLMSKVQIADFPKSLEDRPRAALAFDSSDSSGQTPRVAKAREDDLQEMKSSIEWMKSMVTQLVQTQRNQF